ncbi:MAG: hypothetical protein ACK5N6_13100, partial [Microcystis sp.]|uniref:hypothetical protein n=1 Tax=Microcystis sp. TaxID=1127 RepID=UPI00391AE998
KCISIVANSISLKKYEAIKIIFIRVDSLNRKTFGLEIILWRGLLITGSDATIKRKGLLQENHATRRIL